jgi:uncharacterized damage-inducible protein DinB
MEAKKWFERKFDFDFGPDHYAEIYQHLKVAPVRLREAVNGLAESVLDRKPADGWSIKEHAGHLSVLEPLWRTRFQDIDEKRPVLTTTDLTNSATTEAHFNQYSIGVLLDRFLNERSTTLALLDSLNMLDEDRTSLHPRLQQPMRMIDYAYFVAEHDEHHLLRIKEIAADAMVDATR